VIECSKRIILTITYTFHLRVSGFKCGWTWEITLFGGIVYIGGSRACHMARAIASVLEHTIGDTRAGSVACLVGP
jgi:hypothetical protein